VGTTSATTVSHEWSQSAAVLARVQLREWRIDALPAESTFDVSPDGRCIVVGSESGHLSFYTVADGTRVGKAAHSHSSGIVHSVFAANGLDVLTLADSSYVRRWRHVDAAVYAKAKREYAVALMRKQVEEELIKKGTVSAQGTRRI